MYLGSTVRLRFFLLKWSTPKITLCQGILQADLPQNCSGADFTSSSNIKSSSNKTQTCVIQRLQLRGASPQEWPPNEMPSFKGVFKEHLICISMSSACHQHVISISSARHQQVISVSSACHQHVISMSSACHQHVISMSSASHQHLISMSSACRQHVISMSSACHQHLSSMS